MPAEHGREGDRAKSSKSAVLAMPLKWIKSNPMQIVKLLKTYGTPFAGAALAGPLATMLPLGSLSPFAALLASSIANFHLRRSVIGGLYSSLSTGGVSAVQSRLLSLLSFLSLSATFETLELPLQTWINDVILSLGSFGAILASLSFAMVAEVTGLFGVFPRMLRLGSTSAMLSSLQALVVTKVVSWSRRAARVLWQYLVGHVKKAFNEVRPTLSAPGSISTRAISNMAQTRLQQLYTAITKLRSKESTVPASKGTEEQLTDDWEVLDLEEVYPDDMFDHEERSAELVGEITELIDTCEGVQGTEWDELIAMLEEEQKVYKGDASDVHEFEDVELTEPEEDAVDADWELVG